MCVDKNREKDGEEGEGEGEEGEGEGEREEGKMAGKKSKKPKAGAGLMIEQDPSKLDAEFDHTSQIDPLFKKTAAAFDEGGVGGLLLNNLHLQ